jgi:outer membrane protein assembly factor BamB
MKRTSILAWILSACFVTAAWGQQNNWSQFLGPDMTRSNPYETTLSVNNVKNLKLVWSYTPGAQIYSSPAELNNVVYAGSYDGNLYAWNAQTGAKLWSFFTEVGSWIFSSPAVANGVVYFSSVYPGVPGVIYAVTASTGKLLWSYPTFNGSYGTPTVANGVVYCGDYGGRLYALNATTGAEVWIYDTGTQIASAPAVVNGVVYVASENDSIYALDASTGAELWSFATGNQIQSSPAVTGGLVYFGSHDGNLYALNASTGAFEWSFNTGEVGEGSPAVANGVVFIGSLGGNVYGLDAKTGARIWTFTTAGPVSASPAVANGVVYISSDSPTAADNFLYALNATTGHLLWSYAVGGEQGSSSPAVANGMVYFGSGNIEQGTGKMYAFGVPLGTLTFIGDSGIVGATAKIVGHGFKDATGVSFSGTPASFTVKTDTFMTAIVPDGATTGDVTVTELTGTLQSQNIFHVLPTTQGFVPNHGPVGTVVTIHGMALTQTKAVSFDGVPASSFTVLSDAELEATVPEGANTGDIKITTAGGSFTTCNKFYVTP